MGGLPSKDIAKEAPANPAEYASDYSEGPFSTIDGTAEAVVRLAKEGPASGGADGWAPTTIPAILKLCAEKSGDKPAMRVERGLPEPEGMKVPPPLPLEEWKTWTHKEFYEFIFKCAKSLIKLGVVQHDAVNIFGFNSPEWIASQYAAIFAGAKVAGIYPTDTTDQVKFKVEHSGARVAICEDKHKFDKFAANIEDLKKLTAIVCWDYQHGEKSITRADGSECKVMTFDEFLELGNDVADADVQARIDAQKPGHCCALIYTSGTTGNPKAVMISHDNILCEASIALKHIPDLVSKPEAVRIMSYLPLTHVAGMMVDIIMPVVITSKGPAWVEVYFARPYDLKLMSMGDRLRGVRPTIFLGVPRVWEKIADKVKAVGATTKGLKKKVATFAKAKGLKHALACQLGGNGKVPSHYGIAEKIQKKIKMTLGLDQCVFGFTGAAPMAKETFEYFAQLGININEVYGMSENTGAITWSTDRAHIWGSCGYVMPGFEFKIFNDKGEEIPPCDDIFNAPEECQGELCYRGRNIMMGYLANPDLGEEHVAEIQKKTDEAIDKNGWLHSGDKGCIGKNGMVKITGRYKELIIGAGGENIAPVPIEDAVKQACPAISNIMMVGDKRKFNIALVTLKAVGATGTAPGTEELAGAALGVDGSKTIPEACKSEAYAKHITDAITAVNKTVPNNASKIQKFTILPLDLSSDTGELTPTFKLKRSVVEKMHAKFIDSMYESKDAYVPYVKM